VLFAELFGVLLRRFLLLGRGFVFVFDLFLGFLLMLFVGLLPFPLALFYFLGPLAE
jgi:hypothetical protein